MEQVRREFEEYVADLHERVEVLALTDSEDEISATQRDELIAEYRAKLNAQTSPLEGRELLARFKEEVNRL